MDSSTVATGTPTFTWELVTGATSYQIQVDNDSNFSSPIDNTVTATEWTPATALTSGAYYWRVTALNSHGTPGAWSAVWTAIVP